MVYVNYDFDEEPGMGAKKRRKTNQNRAGKWCIGLILIAFVGVMSVHTIKLQQKSQEYAKRQAELELQLEQETARQAELEEYEAYTQSPEYVEDIAKSKLGLAYDNEIIFMEVE